MFVELGPWYDASELLEVVPCNRLGLSVERGEVRGSSIGVLAGAGILDELVYRKDGLSKSSVAYKDIKPIKLVM